jgi:hypothetical protein
LMFVIRLSYTVARRILETWHSCNCNWKFLFGSSMTGVNDRQNDIFLGLRIHQQS